MLIKRRDSPPTRGKPVAVAGEAASPALDRRSFLRRSGLMAGGLAAAGSIQLGAVRKAEAAGSAGSGPWRATNPNRRPPCSVGCTVTAEVVNGVWVGQEPSYGSPINRGTHCAKGAAIRELVTSDRRLKYPMKLAGGEWHRISWDQAIEEVGSRLLEIREKSGAEAVYALAAAPQHERRSRH